MDQPLSPHAKTEPAESPPPESARIDRMTEDDWVADFISVCGGLGKQDSDRFRTAFRYGVRAATRYNTTDFDEVELSVMNDWRGTAWASGVRWDQVRGAVRAGYVRARGSQRAA